MLFDLWIDFPMLRSHHDSNTRKWNTDRLNMHYDFRHRLCVLPSLGFNQILNTVHCQANVLQVMNSYKLESYSYQIIWTNVIPTVIIKKFFHFYHYSKVCSLLLKICCFRDKKNAMHPVKNGRMFSEEWIFLINFVFPELQKKILENLAKWSLFQRKKCWYR